jgi:hypothetical protein
MADLAPEVQAVREAIQNLVNAIEDEPHLLDSAVVIWESVTYSDDGETMRRISYAVPTDNFSASAALGLVEAGKHYIRLDVLGADDE